MLSGHARICATVSGVTAAPIEAPSSAKAALRMGAGMLTGAPARAAAATAIIDPASQGAGRPSKAEAQPPAVPRPRVRSTQPAVSTSVPAAGRPRPSLSACPRRSHPTR